MTTNLRVVKIGGSLLTLQNVVDRVNAWLDTQPEATTLLVVGGGPTVDTIRDLAQLFSYTDEFLHWLCVDLLEASFQLVREQANCWNIISSREGLSSIRRVHNRSLVRIATFYSKDLVAGLPIPLPIGWQTTTDSLAALLAHVVAADELVLLKSCDVSDTENWESLAEMGIVDRAFPNAVAGIPNVRCANIRSVLQFDGGNFFAV